MPALTERLRGYWSGVYRGRNIAAAHTMGIWLVYLDYVLQDNARFRTLEEACSWLCREVDAAGVFSSYNFRSARPSAAKRGRDRLLLQRP
jgi:hypothetical protein